MPTSARPSVASSTLPPDLADLRAHLGPDQLQALDGILAENERLLARERDARAEAEVAQERLSSVAASLDRSLTEARILNEIAAVVAGEEDLPALLGKTLKLLRQAVPFSNGAAYFLEDGRLVASAAVGPGAAGILQAAALPADGPARSVLQDGNPRLLPGSVDAPARLLVPLAWRMDVFGLLDVTSPAANAFRDHHLELLERVAFLLSGAVATARLYRAAQDEIGERTRAEAQLKQQRDFASQVLEHMGQGLIVTNAERRFVFANRAYASMVGYAPEDIIGKTSEDLTMHDDHTIVQGMRSHRTVGAPVTSELRLRRADGTPVHALINAVPRDPANPREGSISVITDLTERKHLEEALAHARDQALEASRLKSDFLATMSHEIRTPLNGVIGLTELLLGTPLDTAQREYAEAARQSGELLLALVNDILDFSKVEAGRLELEEADLDVRGVATAMVSLLEGQARGKSVALRCQVAQEVPVKLRGDGLRLGQVFLNLLSNGVKFTDAGEVALSIRLLSSTPHDVLLHTEVRDTGPGIDRETKSRLFTPFTQADGSTTRRFGGTGLGLAISKRLVELMGGEIGVESVPGQGSVFWFTARVAREGVAGRIGRVGAKPARGGARAPHTPRRRDGERTPSPLLPERRVAAGARHREARRAATPSSLPARRPRVLVVDDLPVNHLVMVGMLDKLGCHVEQAFSGHDALRKLGGEPFDVVLMDCHMPGMDGFQATALLRRAEGGRTGQHLPVIAVAASALQGDRERCLAAGMDDFVAKPVRLAELGGTLARWVEGVRLPAPELPRAEAPPPSPTLTPGVSLVDPRALEHLREFQVLGGPDVVADAGALFFRGVPSRLTEMELALGRNQASSVGDVAHAVKGSASVLGLTEVVAVCQALERLGREGSLQGAPGLLIRLRQALARGEQAFTAALGGE